MSEPVLRIKNLKKRYNKDNIPIDVLRGVDLEIYDGDFITIMGPSGAGKSTFLHIIGTLDTPTEGNVFFRDRDVRTFTEDEASQFRNVNIGFVFQFYHLLQDFNVIENIMMPLLIRGKRPGEALGKAEEFLGIMGLARRKTHRPGELSGGEQQRVAIARALVNEPEIILADEPTGNLDRKTGQEVLEYILAVRKALSATLVLVTHDPMIGSIGTRRFNMVDGELFSADTA